MTQTIEARCKEIGIVGIEANPTACGDGSSNCDCGAYDHYRINDAAALHKTVTQFAYVARPNGATVSSSKYTPRMARNDFNAYAQ